MIETILIILLIVWLLGGLGYGHTRWYGRPANYSGSSFDPMMIIWIVVIVAIVIFLFRGSIRV